MSNLLKKTVLSFLASLVMLFSIAPYLSVAAAPTNPPPTSPPGNSATPAPEGAGAWYDTDFKDWWTKVYDSNVSPDNEIFGERYTAAQVQWVIYSIWSFVLNWFIPKNVTACLLTNSADLTACATVLGNAIGIGGVNIQNVPRVPQKQQGLASLVFATDRPFSGISYVKGKVQNFSLVPTAKAQSPGFGYDALQPVQDMWRGTRNIAFGLFVIAAVIFAFMIMFRVKISPQVVISIQSAIPKLIIALILVTFSYAIAGFLIDLMYVLIGLISVIASSWFSFGASNVGPIHIPGLGPTQYFNFLTLGQPFNSNQNLGVFGLLVVYLAIIPFAFAFVIIWFLGALQSLVLAVITGAAAGFIIASIIGNIIWIVLGIILLILVIIVIWHTIKTGWMLLKAFVNVLLLTIFAPVQIVAGTFIPSLSFGTWVKSFATNLLTFVVTSTMILLMYVFMALGVKLALDAVTGGTFGNFVATFIFGADITGGSQAVSGYWPPLLGGGNGGVAVGFLFLCASFVIFTLLPKVADMIAAFMSGKPFSYGSAVGEALNPLGMFSFAGKTASNAASGWVGDQFYNPKGGGTDAQGRPIASGLIPTMINRVRNAPSRGANTHRGGSGGGAINIS